MGLHHRWLILILAILCLLTFCILYFATRKKEGDDDLVNGNKERVDVLDVDVEDITNRKTVNQNPAFIEERCDPDGQVRSPSSASLVSFPGLPGASAADDIVNIVGNDRGNRDSVESASEHGGVEENNNVVESDDASEYGGFEKSNGPVVPDDGYVAVIANESDDDEIDLDEIDFSDLSPESDDNSESDDSSDDDEIDLDEIDLSDLSPGLAAAVSLL